MADTHHPTPIGDLIDTWLQQGARDRQMDQKLDALQQLVGDMAFYLSEIQHGWQEPRDLKHMLRCLSVLQMHADDMNRMTQETLDAL